VPDSDPAALLDDLVQPFRIDAAAVRGRLVRLGGAIDGVVAGHDYPAAVAELLGELTVVAAAMAGAFKFQGALSLQTSSDGAVPLMIAEYRAPADEDRHTTPARLRGYARFDADRVTGSAPGELLGTGHLAFTVDTGPNAERYQGVVALEGASIVESIHAYFRQSDQFDAAMRVDVGRSGNGSWRAGGVLIQRMPVPGRALGEPEDDWFRALAFLGSTSRRELLDAGLAPRSLLRRLFPEDDVRVWRPVPVEARCRCSRGRVDTVLRSFPARELEDMVVDGAVTVTCEFCNAGYEFAPAELGLLNISD
jgi:molecular chaperone Hsp33